MSIKKFESFNLRKPTLINYAISKEKIETIGTESFSEKEIEFFQKIKEENKTADEERDHRFTSTGITTLRFSDTQIFHSIESVIAEIKNSIIQLEKKFPLQGVRVYESHC